jgi:hypothetical protein
VGCSLALLAAASADATVPKFKNKVIVPGSAIGGLKVGVTKAKARSLWGKGDHCYAITFTCQFEAPLAGGGLSVFSAYYFKKGKIVAVQISLSRTNSIDRKLKKLKTSKGIGLGSSMAKARSRYHLGKPSGGEAGLSRATVKKGKRCTLFYAPTPPYDKVEAIQVGICGAGGLV